MHSLRKNLICSFICCLLTGLLASQPIAAKRQIQKSINQKKKPIKPKAVCVVDQPSQYVCCHPVFMAKLTQELYTIRKKFKLYKTYLDEICEAKLAICNAICEYKVEKERAKLMAFINSPKVKPNKKPWYNTFWFGFLCGSLVIGGITAGVVWAARSRR